MDRYNPILVHATKSEQPQEINQLKGKGAQVAYSLGLM
jgi:hypothetical protein